MIYQINTLLCCLKKKETIFLSGDVDDALLVEDRMLKTQFKYFFLWILKV